MVVVVSVVPLLLFVVVVVVGGIVIISGSCSSPRFVRRLATRRASRVASIIEVASDRACVVLLTSLLKERKASLPGLLGESMGVSRISRRTSRSGVLVALVLTLVLSESELRSGLSLPSILDDFGVDGVVGHDALLFAGLSVEGPGTGS